VHRDRRAPIGKRALELLDEEALAAGLDEGHIDELVAARGQRQ